jgi:hypothetical protein
MHFCPLYQIELEFGNYKPERYLENFRTTTCFVRFKDPKSIGFDINWIVKNVEFRVDRGQVITINRKSKDKFRCQESRARNEFTYSFATKDAYWVTFYITFWDDVTISRDEEINVGCGKAQTFWSRMYFN